MSTSTTWFSDRNDRWCFFAVHGRLPFAFLPPFTPRALPRFFTTMAALTSAGHALACSVPAVLPSSRLHSFPDILSPTTPTGTSRASVIARGGCGAIAPQTSPVASRLVAAVVAESCSFVIMVCLVVSVAPHPASRRRSYFNFSPAQRLPVA